MFSFDRRSVTLLAEQNDFPKDTMEKVLRLAEILSKLSGDAFDSTRLVLKGGTALQFVYFGLRRLSVDIDLDLDMELTLEEMQKIRPTLEKAIKAMMDREGYLLVADSRVYHALSSLSFQYTNLFGSRDRIEIEINYVNRIHILEPVRKTVTIKGIAPFTVLVLPPTELFATKLAALIGRGKPRDIYDVWLFENSQWYQKEFLDDLRRYTLFYVINSMNVDEDTDLHRYIQDQKESIKQTESAAFQTALRSVLKRSEPIEESSFTISAIRLIDALFDQVEIMNNAYFQSYRKGVFAPVLLFRDSPWNKALSHHPMSLWKTNQIREKRNIKHLSETKQG